MLAAAAATALQQIRPAELFVDIETDATATWVVDGPVNSG